MSNAEHQALKPLVDEYGNVHQIADELARGGQGVVYRTKDADLAVKQPLDAHPGQPDKNANRCASASSVRLLPATAHPRFPAARHPASTTADM
jgi:hypothetical protein